MRGTCFFRSDDLDRTRRRELASSPIVARMVDEGEFVRVEWTDRDALKRLTRKGGLFDQRELKTFEADVRVVRRWLTDNPGVQIDRPRRCYFDLEGDSELPFAQKHLGRILCWAIVDGDTGERFSALLAADTDDAERAMLVQMWKVLARFDQVVAWNGERYDFDLIEARTSTLGISVEFARWLWLDQLVLFRRMNVTASESGDEKQSFALDAVARIILGEGKMELDEDELEGLDEEAGIGSQASEVWRRHPDRLVRYCEDDADKLRRIEERTGYIEILQAVAEACAVFPDTRGINPTSQVEGFLMRLGARRGMRFRTHQYSDEVETFKGADVLEVEKGLHREEVHVVDFARMYPSIIISWNMSPETWRPDIRVKEDMSTRPSYLRHLPQKVYPLPEGHCVSATDAVFACEPLGILPEALLEILEQRKQWSKREAQCAPGTPAWQEAHRRAIAYKQIANCFYGVISSSYSRFYERAVGEAVTRTGAWLLQSVIAAGRERGFRTVLADTDSNGFRGATREQAIEFARYCNEELFPRLIAEKKAPRNELRIEYEKAFRRICILVKKRYFAMWAHYKGKEATADSKPEVKGLEFKRGDSCKLVRRFQEEIIHAILGYHREAPVDDPRELVPIIERYQRHVFDEPLKLDDVVQSKMLAKPIRDYVRKEKKAPPPAKLRGEDVQVFYSDLDCPSCGGVPASSLEVGMGKCPRCSAANEEGARKWRKRKSSVKGMCVLASGERIVVDDGRKATAVWVATIEQTVAFKSLPKHVQLARELELRGHDVGARTRIEFVEVDVDDPFGTVLASDFHGALDRYALWNTVFTPTRRVLDVAFPNGPDGLGWGAFVRVKPHVARAQEIRARQVAARKAPTRQGSLF